MTVKPKDMLHPFKTYVETHYRETSLRIFKPNLYFSDVFKEEGGGEAGMWGGGV